VQPPASPEPLTIDDATTYALKHNTALAEALDTVNREKGVIDQARVALHPNLSAALSANHQATQQFAYLGSIPVVNAQKDTKYIGLNGTIPLDISGEIHTAVSQAQYQAMAAECAAAAARNNVIMTTRLDYLEALRAEDLVASANKDLDKTQTQVKETQTQVDAGQMAKFDLDRAQTAVAAAEDNVLAATQTRDLAIAELRSIIGMKQSDAITITEADLGDNGASMLPPIDNAVRPEVLQAQAELTAAEKGIRLARASRRPSFHFSGNIGYSPSGTNFGQGIDTAQITANLVLPIDDGGMAKAQSEQAAAMVSASRDQLDAVRQGIDLELQQANVRLQSAIARESVAENAMAGAKNTYGLATLRFTEGEAPQVEVTDAQGALTQAQTALINAHWDLLVARNAYMGAIGQYAYPPSGQH
jgi:outer membrane protein TolC